MEPGAIKIYACRCRERQPKKQRGCLSALLASWFALDLQPAKMRYVHIPDLCQSCHRRLAWKHHGYQQLSEPQSRSQPRPRPPPLPMPPHRKPRGPASNITGQPAGLRAPPPVWPHSATRVPQLGPPKPALARSGTTQKGVRTRQPSSRPAPRPPSSRPSAPWPTAPRPIARTTAPHRLQKSRPRAPSSVKPPPLPSPPSTALPDYARRVPARRAPPPPPPPRVVSRSARVSARVLGALGSRAMESEESFVCRDARRVEKR